MKSRQTLLTLAFSLSLIVGIPPVFNPLPVVAQSTAIRSLEIKRIQGRATLNHSSQTAKQGNRLVSVGQGLSTGSRSSAVLNLDAGIGTINVAENTSFTIKELRSTADGGSVTVIEVTKGQVRLSVRPFTNPSSRLEVKTPAGIAGVRGTEFGVAVAFDGQTNVMTNEGSVAVTGAERTVAVSAGYASIVVEGQPPTKPTKFTENLDLKLNPAQRMETGNWQVIGKVDPFNFVWVNEEPVTVSADGTFTLTFAQIPERFLTLRVLTPLGGTRTTYTLVQPESFPFTLQGDRHEF